MDCLLFGRNVKKFRALAELTQEQLSEKAFCTSSYIGQIENGKCNTSLEVAVNIANALGVSIDLLVLESLDHPEIYMTRDLLGRISSYTNKQKLLAYDMIEKLLAIIEGVQQ